MNEILDVNYTALAEIISRRWREDRPYFALNRKARGTWLQGSSWRQPANSALQLHWSRRSSALPMPSFLTRMALPERRRGDLL